MKRLALLLCLTAIPCFAQQTVTITELTSGMYTLSSPVGVQTINVMPLGGGNYSFYSNGQNATVMSVSPGMYTVTGSNGLMGNIYINSLGDGWYSFSNPAVHASPATQPIPLVANSVKTGTVAEEQSRLRLQSEMATQMAGPSCASRGGVVHKENWYSAPRCMTPQEIEVERYARMHDEWVKKNAKEEKKNKK